MHIFGAFCCEYLECLSISTSSIVSTCNCKSVFHSYADWAPFTKALLGTWRFIKKFPCITLSCIVLIYVLENKYEGRGFVEELTSMQNIKIRYVIEDDKSYWFTLDRYLNESEFILKVRDKRGYIISDDDKPIGIMRYGLFMDIIPFLTLIYFDEEYRGKGFGKQAMQHWENEMRELGYKMIMTSTQVDEQAQHFYRKLGYIDRGAIFFDNTPFEQAQEMFMLKNL